MAGQRPADEPIVHVVDDDQSFLRSVSRLLRAARFEVSGFTSAEDFLSYLLQVPDVRGCVILDLQMPGLGGLELQKIVQQQQQPLPVIFLTGYGDVPSSVRALKQNAVDFLMKPAPADELVAAVKRAIERDSEARETQRQEREILARYEGLTPREREVLQLVVRGLINKEIAFELGTVERTIKAHRAQIMSKMHVNSLADLVRTTEHLNQILKRVSIQSRDGQGTGDES
jgi:FixJ family two-component response regulator